MKITVCFQSCGEETEKDCLEAFEPYRGFFEYQEVRNITPAHVALNAMLDQCNTPYLIPLDADMIVYPGFSERIYKELSTHENDSSWHSLLFPLWDTLTQKKIMALKVFRMGIIKQFPYKNDQCPDIQHYLDLTSAGYRTISFMHEEPIGNHVVKGNFFCYAKYRDLYLITRSKPKNTLDSHYEGGRNLLERSKNHYLFFKKRFDETGNQDYLYCLAGMVEGLTSEVKKQSKDLSDKEMRVSVEDAERIYLEWRKKNMIRIM